MSSKNYRTRQIVDNLLLFGLGSGAIASSFIAPGAILGFAPIVERYLKGYSKRESEREYQRIVTYMQRQELLEVDPKNGNGLVLTKQGRNRAQQAQVRSLTIDTPTQWDGKWRIVMFDIPQSKSVNRDRLVRHLKRLQFYQLQRSVWVHPYPCQTTVEDLAVLIEVDQYLNFIDHAELGKSSELQAKFGFLN